MKKQASYERWVIFLLLLVLSLALRLFRLNNGFWEDEITTLTRFAHKGWLDVLTEIPYPNNHILYTLLLKLSINIFGEHEWSARLPALIFGTITPAAAYLVFRKRFSEFVGVCAGLFMAMNYWMVWFSQDARGYSGMFLSGFLGTCFFLEYIEDRNWRYGLAYVFTAGIAVYFHLYGIFLIAAQFLWALIVYARKQTDGKTFGYIFGAGVFSLIIYAPGASQLYKYTVNDARYIAQIEYFHFEMPVVLGKFMMMLAGTRNLIICILIGLASIPGIILLFKKWPGFASVYVFSSLLIVAFTLIAKVFMFPRFLFFTLPFFLVSLALSLEFFAGLPRTDTGRRVLSFLLPALVFAGLIGPLVDYYVMGKEHFREATVYVRANYPGKQLLTNRKVLNYYMPEAVQVPQKSGPTPELVKGKLILVRRLMWETYDNQEVKKLCRTEKLWPSSGFEEHDFVLLNCQ